MNPNELLAHGDVDANYFQHLPYLRSQEEALDQNFAVAATVHIEPLGVYSRKAKSFAEVKDGGTVAVPNNVTNLSRALYLLQDQKLIRLKDGFAEPDEQLATPNDIAENPKHLKVLEVEIGAAAAGPGRCRPGGDQRQLRARGRADARRRTRWGWRRPRATPTPTSW